MNNIAIRTLFMTTIFIATFTSQVCLHAAAELSPSEADTEDTPHKDGENIAEADSHGRTPLIIAAEAGNKDLVDMLLAAKADPTSVDKEGFSALMEAACSGHINIVKRLLAAKADPTQVSKHGRNALMFAAFNGNAAIVEVLAEANPDTATVTDNDGMNAWCCADRGMRGMDFGEARGHLQVFGVLKKYMPQK